MKRGFRPFSLNLGGRLAEFDRPAVMGIVNVTDDSFYAPSRGVDSAAAVAHALAQLADGADMIDVGGCSTRPGSEPVDAATEERRAVAAVAAIREACPDAVISIDTFRGAVARAAIAAGADIINDVSGLEGDSDMLAAVIDTRAPYILTCGPLDPALPPDLTAVEAVKRLQCKVRSLTLAGVNDIIVDPGIGFGKTLSQNYALIDRLEILHEIERPILVGVSRKSLICNILGITPDDALNATTVINTVALAKGAAILRVHDAREAVEAVKIMAAISDTNHHHEV